MGELRLCRPKRFCSAVSGFGEHAPYWHFKRKGVALVEWIQVIVLAVVQGITEFLPISSSAHLILVPRLTGWPDQGLGFDLAVHLGTLAAVVLYFRAELRAMARDWERSVVQRRRVGESHLAWAVCCGALFQSGLLACYWTT